MLFLWFMFGLIFKGSAFDPDVDICENPVLSGAANADDANSYIFKGKYFWQTNNLVQSSGIIGFAQLVSNKWPEVKKRVKTVLVVPDNEKKPMTVFIDKDNKWFAYQNGVQKLHGSAIGWPEFQNLKITTSFPKDFESAYIFILHTDNKKYSLYNFTDVSKPILMRSGETNIRDQFVRFLDDNSLKARVKSKMRAIGSVLKDLIDVNGALIYGKSLVLLSKVSYCVMNLTQELYGKECNITSEKTTLKLLKCPLNLSQRPTTISAAPTVGPTLTQDQSKDPNQTPNSGSNGSNSSVGSPTDNSGSVAPEAVPEAVSEAVPGGGAGGVNSTSVSTSSQTSEVVNENSSLCAIIFIVGLIVVTLISIAIIVIISKVTNKRPKGAVSVIK